MNWRLKEGKLFVARQLSEELDKVWPLKIRSQHNFEINSSRLERSQDEFEKVLCIWSEEELLLVDHEVLLDFLGQAVHEALLKSFFN